MSMKWNEIKAFLDESQGKFRVLLLVESSPSLVKVRTETPDLTVKTMFQLTAENGPLDRALQVWSRPMSQVRYRRIPLDRSDTEALVGVGVSWLPQVRLLSRRGKVLMRSSVSVGDNGQWVCGHVGGRSFLSPENVPNLLDALEQQIESKR
jgi:hypothetical protein